MLRLSERAFVAQRLGRVNVAFDDPALRDGVGQNGFQFGQNVFRASANLAKQIKLAFKALNVTEEQTSAFYFNILLFNC
jgi:hypothetical protein